MPNTDCRLSHDTVCHPSVGRSTSSVIGHQFVRHVWVSVCSAGWEYERLGEEQNDCRHNAAAGGEIDDKPYSRVPQDHEASVVRTKSCFTKSCFAFLLVFHSRRERYSGEHRTIPKSKRRLCSLASLWFAFSFTNTRSRVLATWKQAP